MWTSTYGLEPVCVAIGNPQQTVKLRTVAASNTATNTILLRSEIPNSMCAKLRTVAASNNRDARNLSSRTLVIMFNRSHVTIGRASTSQSLLLLLARATYIMVSFFTHIPFVVNHILFLFYLFILQSNYKAQPSAEALLWITSVKMDLPN